MPFYSELPAQRTRQIVADALVVLWVVLWWRIGAAVHEQVSRLAAPGRTLEGAGRSLGDGLESAGEAVEGVPLVGEQLRTPFDAAGGAARSISDAGVGVQDAVGRIALLVALAVAAWPVVTVVALHVWRRLRWARRAARVRDVLRTPGGSDLLALRALATLSPHRLLEIRPDVAAAWRRGDDDVVADLAAAVVRRSGVDARRHAPAS